MSFGLSFGNKTPEEELLERYDYSTPREKGEIIHILSQRNSDIKAICKKLKVGIFQAASYVDYYKDTLKGKELGISVPPYQTWSRLEGDTLEAKVHRT